MPIRFVDTAAATGRVTAEAAAAAGLFQGTHSPPASRTGVILAQTGLDACAIQGTVTAGANRTGQIAASTLPATSILLGTSTSPSTDPPQADLINYLAIGNQSLAEGNSGQSAMVFTVVTTRAFSRAVLFDYATSDITATAGSDYVATSGVATLAAGQLTAQLSVQIIGDAIAEANETFLMTISNPRYAS